ncbi:MAG: xanthine dehydrogenase family protein molybdopterin-binding subunit, partial [Actinobacteria bacterium]
MAGLPGPLARDDRRRSGYREMVRGLVGTRVERREDRHLLTRGGTYVADLDDPLLDGALHAVFLRSTVAHARIRVDVAHATSAPGVVGAFSADDLDVVPRPSPINPKFTTQWLASDVVRWVGQPVAVVVATDIASAIDALEQIDVEYETLPVVVDSEAALRDEVLLYPTAGTNLCSEATNGNVAFEAEDIFAGCDIVVEGRLVNQRLAACPLEVRGAAVAWTADGRLVYWTSSQLP